jgi:hypothetical protein
LKSLEALELLLPTPDSRLPTPLRTWRSWRENLPDLALKENLLAFPNGDEASS